MYHFGGLDAIDIPRMGNVHEDQVRPKFPNSCNDILPGTDNRWNIISQSDQSLLQVFGDIGLMFGYQDTRVGLHLLNLLESFSGNFPSVGLIFSSQIY
jgi:hypothetical protein